MPRASIAALCLAAAACGAGEPTSVDRESSCEIAQSLPLAGRPQADLVFVVDRSAAMAPYRETLAANARRFDGLMDLADGRPSLHVAVLPADGGGTIACAGDTRATFDCIASLGDAGGAPAPLAALDAALADPANAHFRRSDAWLVVVIIAAQDDISPDAPATYSARLAASHGMTIATVVNAATAPRLVGFAADHWDRRVVALAGADWSGALSRLGNTTTLLATLCLVPEATSCAATLSSLPAGAAEVLPRCAAATPRPCWSLAPSLLCGPGAQEIRLERDELPPRLSLLELRCAVPCEGL